MSYKSIYISIILAVLLVSGFSMKQDTKNSSYTLISTTSTYTAGDMVSLDFNFEGSADVFMYCSNSYGSVIIQPTVGNTLKFEIPKSITDKSGTINWELHATSKLSSGQILIQPKSEINKLETYIGPPSIEAGGTDYTMLVAIPTDELDNPLVDSTKVVVKHQFLDDHKDDDIYTKHGFTYKNLFSYEQTGRMLINSESLDLNSKEFDVNVVPAIPTNFTISADRIHNYADGNQITTFRTSVIKDRYNNTVSDGTFVSFIIINSDGNIEETSGATIDGIATAKLLHPDHEEQWAIKAYIEGMANSETINIKFEQAVTDFEVSFSDSNRMITVGPLQSFMDQYIPDGLRVVLTITKDGAIENQIIEQSVDGYVKFILNKDRYTKGQYDLKIEAAGITKSFENTSYE
ncbi:hypothetical protein [Winogradskyella tangerina]|uniref:hypothetical protein n=1 Tax=Winogradskyella tangerina TaxID=2023240 RepID=UPI000DBE6F5D|nr:hypothetical protein [Winogradskyella tangerina]